ncbi:MAG: hypothetical protein N3G76_00755 [Candidatus Micrarchaeota archaeon]|nr:hypothetical protein [Candidatus Micrarchaeota archaeon]
MKIWVVLAVVAVLAGAVFAESVESCAKRCCFEAKGTYDQDKRQCSNHELAMFDYCMAKCYNEHNRMPSCSGIILLIGGVLALYACRGLA